MICPGCGTENSAGAKFCRECGYGLALTCPECGHPRTPEQKFCVECGASLTAAPARRLGAGETGAADRWDGGAAASRPVAHEPAVVAAPAEMRLVSVLFVDLVGFTALSEKREAEDVRELLSTYFERTRTIIERHGGTVEKFIGDAVMAVWGVPVAREDDAERAVRTALEIVDAVTAFGEEVRAPDLRARAGVVTGQVAALENPGEGLVVGDRVNTASRVQSAASPGSVFVDEVTRQVTSAAIAYADGGEHTVKGKAEPLHLWRAVRVLGGVGGADREQGLDAGFVGRDADLRLLKELFHASLERRSARLLAVTGEAGVGKSRLRREFFNYVDGLSSTVLYHLGRCLSHGEGVAYWALAEMVRQRLGIAEEASAEEATERLEAGLERWVPDAEDRAFIAPRLGALLGVAEPGLDREELFAGWRLFFERLADHEPVALVFEDLQWADAGLLDFVEGLLDWSSESPIFILALARPELSAGREGWPAGHRGATIVRLEPLEEDATRQLLANLVEDLPRDAADQIVGRSQGVPLYAIETVRALLDRGVLGEREGRLELLGELGALDVPASLSALLSARLDALGPDERGLVMAMSVFGGSFPRSAAEALSDTPVAGLEDVLHGLVRRGVLVIRTDRLSPDRGQYAFAQDLLRAVAYERLSRQDRRARHLAAAEHLRSAFPNEGEDVAEVLANHLLAALTASAADEDEDGLRVRTLAALRRAARRAETIGAPDTAGRLYDTAAELTDDARERARLTQLSGEMAAQSGRAEDALARLEAAHAAFTAADDDGGAARVLPHLARMLMRLGRMEEAIDRAAVTIDQITGRGLDAELAALHVAYGRALAWVGRFGEAIAVLDTALELAQALKLTAVLAEALQQKGVALLYTGRGEEARLLLLGARELGERSGLASTVELATSNISNLCQMWDLPAAAEEARAAVTLARRRGDRFAEVLNLANLWSALLIAGRWDEIDALAEETIATSGETPAADLLQNRLAYLTALRGDAERARAHLDALGDLDDSGDPELEAMHGATTIAVLVADGDHDGALVAGLASLPVAIPTLSAANETVRDGWSWTLTAALALGEADRVREVLDVLAEQPPGHIPPFLEAQLARGRALADALDGRCEEVEAGLRRAIDGFGALGYPYWLAVAQTDLAEWLIDQGRPAEATPLLDEAAAALVSLGAAPALARVHALLSQPSETLAS